MVWPLKEKSEEWCVFFKYLEGVQVEEGTDLIPVAPEVQSEPKDEQILMVIANVFKLVLGLLLKDLNSLT